MKPDYQPSLSPARKGLIAASSFMLLVSLACLALSSYQTRDHCSIKVFDSSSVDCDDPDVPICSDAPAIKFESLLLTPSLAITQTIKCSWRTRAAVLSIITACAGIILSIVFLALAANGGSRSAAAPVVILYVLTFMLLLTTIILEGIDLTKGDNFASDYVRNAPPIIENQPNVIFSQIGYSRGSYIATILLFSLLLVGLTFLLISYLLDRSRIPKRDSVPAGRQISMPVVATTTKPMAMAPPSLPPTTAAPVQKNVEVVDIRRTEQYLQAPPPYTGISAPYTAGGRQERMVDISQEPPANRVNISA